MRESGPYIHFQVVILPVNQSCDYAIFPLISFILTVCLWDLCCAGDRPKVDLKATYGDNMKCLVTERNFGFFCRRFQLPPNAIEDTVSASMENGVLFVRISTSDSKPTPEKKKINIE